MKRGDGFAAQFLLQQHCDPNLCDRSTGHTALHLASTYAECNTDDAKTYAEMFDVASALLNEHKADPNLSNKKG